MKENTRVSSQPNKKPIKIYVNQFILAIWAIVEWMKHDEISNDPYWT